MLMTVLLMNLTSHFKLTISVASVSRQFRVTFNDKFRGCNSVFLIIKIK